jgi:threonine aldolase
MCHAGSHIYADEAGAVEHASNGTKLIPIRGEFSKITGASLAAHCAQATAYGDYGGVPAVVSLTQVNESGLL